MTIKSSMLDSIFIILLAPQTPTKLKSLKNYWQECSSGFRYNAATMSEILIILKLSLSLFCYTFITKSYTNHQYSFLAVHTHQWGMNVFIWHFVTHLKVWVTAARHMSLQVTSTSGFFVAKIYIPLIFLKIHMDHSFGWYIGLHMSHFTCDTLPCKERFHFHNLSWHKCILSCKNKRHLSS